jgi:hypothetical protein
MEIALLIEKSIWLEDGICMIVMRSHVVKYVLIEVRSVAINGLRPDVHVIWQRKRSKRHVQKWLLFWFIFIIGLV